RQIVGVIADTKYRDLRAAVPNTVYLPIGQATRGTERTLHVRTFANPAGMAGGGPGQGRRVGKDPPPPKKTFLGRGGRKPRTGTFDRGPLGILRRAGAAADGDGVVRGDCV